MVKVYWSFGRPLISLAHNITEVVNELTLSLELFHSFPVFLSHILRRIRVESCVNSVSL